jgi:hypothetical protein
VVAAGTGRVIAVAGTREKTGKERGEGSGREDGLKCFEIGMRRGLEKWGRNQRKEGDSRRETLLEVIFIAQAPLLRFEFDDLDGKFIRPLGWGKSWTCHVWAEEPHEFELMAGVRGEIMITHFKKTINH